MEALFEYFPLGILTYFLCALHVHYNIYSIVMSLLIFILWDVPNKVKQGSNFQQVTEGTRLLICISARTSENLTVHISATQVPDLKPRWGSRYGTSGTLRGTVRYVTVGSRLVFMIPKQLEKGVLGTRGHSPKQLSKGSRELGDFPYGLFLTLTGLFNNCRLHGDVHSFHAWTIFSYERSVIEQYTVVAHVRLSYGREQYGGLRH